MTRKRPWEPWAWAGCGVVLVTATVALWMISAIVVEEKVKASLFGAASALTVAVVTLVGGLLTAGRAHSATARANLAVERRGAYARVFATALHYEIALELVTGARKDQRAAADEYRMHRLRVAVSVSVDPSASLDEGDEIETAVAGLESRSQALIDASEQAEKAHADFTEAYSNALLLASPALSSALETFVRDVNSGTQRAASRAEFLQRARAELGTAGP